MEQSLCGPFGFQPNRHNPQSFPLNSSMFVSAMIYQPTWGSTRHNMELRLAIKFSTPYAQMLCPWES